MLLEGTPENVFPHLCPIKEYEWIEPWCCTLIYAVCSITRMVFHFPLLNRR